MRRRLCGLLGTLRLQLAEAWSWPQGLLCPPLSQRRADQFFDDQEYLPTCTLNNNTMAGSFDPLVATAVDLKQLLDDGKITSRHLIERYLQQIEAHNTQGMQLRAVIATAPVPNILSLADELDAERKAGKLRGPFHGLPIIVKDTINTDPELGMGTTLGSYALKSAKPKRSAAAIETFIQKGLLILGKANLSEFGSNKCKGAIAGFSPVGGQTQSPYIEGGMVPGELSLGHSNPGGSSSGSAVSVAAGFCPWSIGAETDGSLNSPASRSSLYALKPTIGTVSGDGVFRLTDSLDSVGGMAKSATDLIALMEMLFLSIPNGPLCGVDMSDAMPKAWTELSVGFVDIDAWQLPRGLLEPDDPYLIQRRAHWTSAMEGMRASGARTVFPIELKQPSAYVYEGQNGYSVIRYGEWPIVAAKYFEDLAESEVRSLADIVKFSEEHPELEFFEQCPNQQSLVDNLNKGLPPKVVSQAVKAMREQAGTEGLGKAIDNNELDVLIAPTDSPICTVAALAGYPVGTMPLGYLSPSGRPHGLSVIAKPLEEHKILGVMHLYEKSGLLQRQPPLPLANWNAKASGIGGSQSQL